MKKIKIRHLDLIPILLIAFMLFKLVFTANVSITGTIEALYSCVSYFIYGLIISYFLNPFVSRLEKRFVKETDSEKKRGTKRSIIIAVVYLICLGVISVFFVSIIPAIAEGMSDFFNNFQTYLANFQNWFNSTLSFVSPQITENLSAVLSEIANNFTGWVTNNVDVGKVGGVVTTAVSGSAKFALNLVFGVVVSIYFLHGKEHLLKQIKRFTYAVFSEERAERVIGYAGQINKIFYDFILSKLVQAFVMFIFGLIVLVPLNVHFAPLISLILAVTNMIPYIGPWLGSVPCVFLVLLYSPIQALVLIIFILVMQLIDNVFIGPKIMSDRVGISPLLVIAGVAIGGTFGGVVGMFIGVPVVAVVKLVFYDNFVERRLKEKNIDIEKT